ncbi:MAG: hypothetical protein ACYS0K_07530 [Planctomycetota bacterium]
MKRRRRIPSSGELEMRFVKRVRIRPRCVAVEVYSRAALNGIRAMEEGRRAAKANEEE